MENIEEKYQSARPYIQSGDIILFRGNRLLSRLIRYFDKSYYNHAGVVFESEGHLMIMDSNAKGVHPDFLSERIRKYEDFCIIRPNNSDEEIKKALFKTFNRGDKGTEYDYFLLLRIAMIKKLQIDFIGLGTDTRDICSEFVKFYTHWLKIKCYKKVPFITPQDFIRYRSKSEVTLLFDRSGA